MKARSFYLFSVMALASNAFALDTSSLVVRYIPLSSTELDSVQSNGSGEEPLNNLCVSKYGTDFHYSGTLEDRRQDKDSQEIVIPSKFESLLSWFLPQARKLTNAEKSNIVICSQNLPETSSGTTALMSSPKSKKKGLDLATAAGLKDIKPPKLRTVVVVVAVPDSETTR